MSKTILNFQGEKHELSTASDEWIKVVYAFECPPCEMCGEPVCPNCDEHYAECECPGPTQDDIYEYKKGDDGELYARKLPECV